MAAGKRKDGESFKEYRARLRDEQKEIKRSRAGVLIWSYIDGTYNCSKHGPIGSGK